MTNSATIFGTLEAEGLMGSVGAAAGAAVSDEVAALSRGGGAGSAELDRCEGVRTTSSSSELSPNICIDNDEGERDGYPS